MPSSDRCDGTKCNVFPPPYNLVCCRALFDLETQTAEREAKLYDVFPRLGIEEAWLAQRRYIAHVVWLRDHC